MDSCKVKALEITAEIVKASVEGMNIKLYSDTGKNVAEYFEAIYNKVSEITSNIMK